MKTRFLIIIVIAVIVVSSATTYMMVPVKHVGSSFNSPWLQENLDAAKIIRESDIPILGADVDEKIGVLTIYMTDENSQKYIQEIDDLIDVPFDILSETQSRELQCLKTYKDIREIPRTHDAATPEWHIVKHLKYSVGQYVELQCPDFSDLESMKMDLKKYSFVTIPQGAVIEGRTSLVPQEITVILGINNTVTWINEDDVSHGITSDTGGDNLWGTPGVLKPEESYSVTFEEAGVFSYHGQPHPWITGRVIVLENDPATNISKMEISEKRSPVDVPNATSENDMYCDTNWNIVTENKLDLTHIKQSAQSTIAQFGKTYFLEERIIDVFENSDGYTVSISGLWDHESVQYQMIANDLGKFGMVYREPVSCQ